MAAAQGCNDTISILYSFLMHGHPKKTTFIGSLFCSASFEGVDDIKP